MRRRSTRNVCGADDDASSEDHYERKRAAAQSTSATSLPRFLEQHLQGVGLYRVGPRQRGFRRDGVTGDGDHEATIIVFMSSIKSPDVEDAFGLARLDRRDPTLLHEQVAAEIRRAIAEGEASPGERIPQAKDLAAELGVNANTVLRALRVLRDEGVIEMGRGRSIRVTGRPDRGVVALKMKELVDVARQYGYRRDDLVAMLEKSPRI